jgi:hypothetical protein
VITLDVGFLDASTAPADHWGLILLRFPNEMSTDTVDAEAMQFIRQNLSLDDMRGRLVVLEPGGVSRLKQRE